MDLNPTFGTQELVESLSHGSGGGKKSPSSGSGSKNKSSSSNTNSSSKSGKEGRQQGHLASSFGENAHVDEAYRRLGQRLSLQAHGDVIPHEEPIVVELQPSSFGAFRPYPEVAQQKMDLERETENELQSQSSGRSLKVAKTRYSDHGDHNKRIRSESLLRKLTFEAKQTFHQWEQAMTMHHKKSEPSSSINTTTDSKLSPHRFAFSQLSIEGEVGFAGSGDGGTRGRHHAARSTGEQLGLGWHDRASHRGGGGGVAMGMGKGLLSAVLEVHSDSNTSASGPVAAERSTRNSPASQSISTKGSTAVSSHGANSNGNGNGSGHGSGNGNGGSIHSAAPGSSVAARGKCLTNPPESVANDGYDNIDGNLIVFENDLIVIPRKGMHSIKAKPTRRASEFRVQSLLGQGTFAQVFQCLLVTTGEVVAVKVVKNKPAYTRQATIEIDVFRALIQQEEEAKRTASVSGTGVVGGAATTGSGSSGGSSRSRGQKDYMVNLICYFMHRSHLCLVFELLGLNLYEVLKRRQFRGLPLSIVRSIVLQSVEGVKELSQKGIVHCDLKPENILFASDDAVRHVINAGETGNKGDSETVPRPPILKNPPEPPAESTGGGSDESRGNSMEGDQSSGSSSNAQTIQMGNVASAIGPRRSTKLIDFGSACFEGYTAHTYIQSRFYRSPEVLIGLPYDSAIDMWSLGCVTAELFLGLPILPGVHEHDQLCRITEMIAKIPDWMLDQGSKASKYFIKFVARPTSGKSAEMSTSDEGSSGGSGHSPKPARASPGPPQTQWRLKTLKEYIVSLSQNDIKKKGGLAKLEKQPGNRYFRRTKLPDILSLHAQNMQGEERDLVPSFIHFLYGLLDPDPWKRWTAFQAMQHPFLTGALHQLRRKTDLDKFDPKDTNHANLDLDFYWKPPWDPAICRRKLLNVQKMREKQQAMRRSLASSRTRGEAAPRGIPRRGSVSPGPAMVPPSSSSTSSRQDLSVDSRTSQPGPSRITASSSSLTDAGPLNLQAQAQIALGSPATSAGLPNTFTSESGARSFNSAGYIPGSGVLSQGDLGIALQRPGVVPATGGDSVHSHHSSYSGSGQSTGSSSYVFDQSIPQAVFQQQQPVSLPGSLPQTTTVFDQTLISNTYGSADQANPMFSHLSGQNAPSFETDVPGRQFEPTPSSAASSVTMEGQGSLTQTIAPPTLPTQQSVFAQQQPRFMSTQQIIQSTSNDQQHIDFYSQQQQQVLQQQQGGLFPQGGAVQQQAIFQSSMQQQQPSSQIPPFQQHLQLSQQQPGQMQPPQQVSQQQPYAMQQPVILAQSNAPGGGMYFVATSANGQPIILQQVGLLNQQQQPTGQPQLPQNQMQQQFTDPNVQMQQQPQVIIHGQQQVVMPSQAMQQPPPFGQEQQQQQQQFMISQQFIQPPPHQQPQQPPQQGGGRYGAQMDGQQRRYQQSPRRSNPRHQRRHHGGGGTSM